MYSGLKLLSTAFTTREMTAPSLMLSRAFCRILCGRGGGWWCWQQGTGHVYNTTLSISYTLHRMHTHTHTCTYNYNILHNLRCLADLCMQKVSSLNTCSLVLKSPRNHLTPLQTRIQYIIQCSLTHIRGFVSNTLQYPLHTWHKEEVIPRQVKALYGQDVLNLVTIHLCMCVVCGRGGDTSIQCVYWQLL